MRTKIFLLSALVTVGLAACSQESEPKSDLIESAPALLEIKLSDSDAPKASGAPVEATETKITTGVIFVFKGLGVDPALDGKASFDFTSNPVTPVRINITRGIRQVYAVANVNPADFASINTLSDLQHISNKLTLSTFRANSSLPVSGFVNNVDATNATTTNALSVSIPMNFIGSRVHVDWDIDNLNTGLTGLTIDGVAILNVNAKSEYIATPNGSGGHLPLTHNILDFLHGVGSTTTFTGSYLPSSGMSGTTNNYDSELLVASADKGFTTNYTYIFENSSQKPIIVAFKGTYNTMTYYWPVVINGALNGIGGANTGDMSASVARATIYKVKAVIKGLGIDDPYTPINPGAMDVTIVPASWLTTVLIDQQFE